MQQKFSVKTVLNSLLFVIVTCFLLYACSKADLSRKPNEDFSKFDRAQLVEMVSKENILIDLIKIDQSILSSLFNETDKPAGDIDAILIMQPTSVNKKVDIENAFRNANFKNHKILADLYERKILLAQALLDKYSFINKMDKNERFIFMSKVIKKHISSKVNPITTNDECSDAYALGMSQCEEDAAVAAAWAAGEAAFASLAGSPLAGGGILLLHGTKAYVDYKRCRIGVVRAWEVCRKNHPIVH